MNNQPTYHHTQRAPLCLLIYAAAIVFLSLGWALRNEPLLQWLFPLVGLLMAGLGTSFHYLAVEDCGDRLAIHFGPLPLFRRRVRYQDIRSVEMGRTTILEGWGIHFSPRGGWVWNIWGRDCVLLRLRKSKLRLGTNDAERLLAFLKSRLAAQPLMLDNIFANLPAESGAKRGDLGQERVDVLVQHPRVRIERIVSNGQASPEGFWYEQLENEWVVVLLGEARLQFEGNAEVLPLKSGEHVLIPANQRHRVAWTSPSEPTVWLAVFFE